jgi:predicted aldo/keto reductase-like oxidoreductase
MQYRKFGKLDFEVSALGFGCMRLPIEDGDGSNIDEAEATRMLHYAIDHGVNYLDTAHPYHDGDSERFLGRALKGGYREKVKLATKMPIWNVQNTADFDKFLNEQLERLQLDYVDFYLLHALGKDSWRRLRDLGVIEWAEKAIADGRFRHLGFSFHEDPEALKEIVEGYEQWAMCLMQHNYMDIENQAGTEGLRYAASKGLGVAIMEPLLGGKLVKAPQPIQEIWDVAENKRPPVEWALQWLWNQPEVSVVLSGMSTMQQMAENVAIAKRSGINTLTAAEASLFDQVRDKYQELSPIPCTQCGYCLPCPEGVDIPGNFGSYNDGIMYEAPDAARGHYKWLGDWFAAGNFEQDVRAFACVQCNECEEKCPQDIPISQWMPVIHRVLGEGEPFVKQL